MAALFRIGLLVAFAAPSPLAYAGGEGLPAVQGDDTGERSSRTNAPDGSTSASDEASAPKTGDEARALPDAHLKPSGEDRLNAAIRAFQTGEPDRAREMLAAILVDPDTHDPDLIRETRLYMGEILYLQNRTDQARKFFEQVIRADPDYEIDPFKFPSDICFYYEQIRNQIGLAAALPPTPPQVPVSVYLQPFGLWQLAHGRPGRGVVMATSGLVSITASIGLFGYLLADGQYVAGDDQARRRLVVLRDLQWSATTVALGVGIWSAIDARAAWRHDQQARIDRDGPAVTVGVTHEF